MKSHPRAALVHVMPKGFTLQRILRSGIEEQHHLILGKNLVVEVGPIGGRMVSKIGLSGYFGEPLIRLVHKTNVSLIASAGVKGDHFERRSGALGVQAQTTES